MLCVCKFNFSLLDHLQFGEKKIRVEDHKCQLNKPNNSEYFHEFLAVELQTTFREDFTITGKAPSLLWPSPGQKPQLALDTMQMAVNRLRLVFKIFKINVEVPCVIMLHETRDSQSSHSFRPAALRIYANQTASPF